MRSLNKIFLASSLVVLLSLIAIAPTKSEAAETTKKKNVILFVADDLGFQIGAYGDKVTKTPALDQLAKMGTRFSRAYCTTASCSASRSVIMTGLYNHSTGHYGHAHGYNHFSTYETVQTLPQILSDSGYRTCSIGKYHLAPREVYKFEKFANDGLVGGSRNPVMMAENARKWINEKDDRPFFLYFCTSDPHRGPGPGNFANFNNKENPYPGTERIKFDPKDMQVPGWLPNAEETKMELAEYYQAVNRVDQGLQRILEILKATNHMDDTMIIFTSDNGPPFPGAKTCLYQAGANLPLIVYDPGQQKKNLVTDAMVCWADLTPTILDFCDVKPKDSSRIITQANGDPISPKRAKPVPWKFHGKSFLSSLEKENDPSRNSVYLSHTFHEITMYYPMRVYIEGKFKYTFNVAHQLPYPFASDLFRSPTWQGVLKRKDTMFGKKTVYSYLYRPQHELYDLEADPFEANNLANKEKHQAQMKKMQEKVKVWQKQTRDPWLLKWDYE